MTDLTLWVRNQVRPGRLSYSATGGFLRGKFGLHRSAYHGGGTGLPLSNYDKSSLQRVPVGQFFPVSDPRLCILDCSLPMMSCFAESAFEDSGRSWRN